MARSTPLSTGIRSSRTTEMYTRCLVPVRDAARTKFRALASSPLAVPAQCAMISARSTAASIPSSLARSPATNSNPFPSFTAAPAEHPDLAASVLQPRDDEAAERACAASDQDGCLPVFGLHRIHLRVVLTLLAEALRTYTCAAQAPLSRCRCPVGPA